MTELIPENSSLLREPCPVWDFNASPEDPETLVQHMYMVMLAEGGVGLSASQIGKLYRVFVMNDSQAGKSYSCFNPEIVEYSSEEVSMEEGCLSFPGLALEVKRAKEVTVRYQNINSEWVEEHLTGLMARCYQHELDHLNGICFVAKVSKLRLDRAKLKRSKALKGS
jgi:peptide deformylase